MDSSRPRISLANATLTDTTPYSSYIPQAWADFSRAHRPGVIEFDVSIAVQLAFYWVPATSLLLLDVFAPAWSRRHKIQAPQKQASWGEIKHCLWHNVANQLASTAIHFGLLYAQGFGQSMFDTSPDLPGAWTVVSDFAYAAVAREVAFYAVHRTLHHPRLYKHLHKQHHTFTAPIGFAAQYAGTTDHVVANTLPVVLPLALRRAHILSFAVWLAWSLLETTCTHSGYDFVLPSARMHDLHHEKFNVNYGGLGLMDYVMGTGVVGWEKKPPWSSKTRVEGPGERKKTN